MKILVLVRHDECPISLCQYLDFRRIIQHLHQEHFVQRLMIEHHHNVADRDEEEVHSCSGKK